MDVNGAPFPEKFFLNIVSRIKQMPPFYLTASAVWFSIQAVPLAITPKLIISLLSYDEQRATGMTHTPFIKRTQPWGTQANV